MICIALNIRWEMLRYEEDITERYRITFAILLVRKDKSKI